MPPSGMRPSGASATGRVSRRRSPRARDSRAARCPFCSAATGTACRSLCTRPPARRSGTSLPPRAARPARQGLAGGAVSILLGCHRHGVPVTVHAALGAEIVHQHPSADGAAIGATSLRDFRRLAGSLPSLDGGGAVLNWGSAVVMPEVFLKALTVARNLEAGRPTGLLAADFDMIRHYRPRRNVVQRPTRAGGTGIQLTGHHELLLTLLVWGVLDALDRS